MTRFVDLTLTLRPGIRGVEFETACTVEREGWNARTLHLYSHAGTHLDAPIHFAAGPGTVESIPLERCIGPAWVAHLREVGPAREIRIADLGAMAARVEPGDALLLHTGWARHCENPALYRDQLPRISGELAEWCVQRGVRMLGVEPPSVADVHNLEEVTRIHKTLLGGGVIIVEGLAGLDELREEKVLFGAFPLKVRDGDGSPCRAFAIEGVNPNVLK